MTDKKEECKHCCGTCKWFNGELDDNDQFCDELETYVNAKNFCCNKWKPKYYGVSMDIKEFAEKISGKENGYPLFTDEELQIAKDNGFVIVYGASDDLMEFEGAIRDEGGCFDGGNVYFDRNGVSQDGTERANCIKALWCDDSARDENGVMFAWAYDTDIPHETFTIYDDGEPYCRGIVFSIDDVK